MIWFTSDLHLCHDRDFIYKPREFKTVGEMNRDIINNINDTVKYNDTLFILGDLVLNNNDEGIRLLKLIRCGDIRVILGNHDTANRATLYKNCFNIKEVSYADTFKYDNYHFYLSHYPTITSNYDDGKGLSKKVINLCGHTHTKDKFNDMDKGIIYHVEMDAHNNRPVSIEQIIEDIRSYYERAKN